MPALSAPTDPPRVAVVMDSTSAYARGVLSGIAHYAPVHGPWDFSHKFFSRRASEEALLAEVDQWEGEGIIAHVRNRAMAERLAARRGPVVNVSGLLDVPELPLVTADNAAVGRLAAAHFADRGFHRVAFAGHEPHVYSWRRRAAFLETASAQSIECHVRDHPIGTGPWDEQASTAAWQAWLADLPKPVGVWAVNDPLARRLLHVCRGAGIAVPDEVAILGCDDDELIWGFVYPPLSSIDLGTQRIGHAAAELLDALMAGEATPTDPILIPPRGVVTRQSTDTFAVDDPLVAQALRYIQRHATHPIRVEDIAEAVLTSRRTLELRFAQTIKMTPFAAIRRVQIDRAQSLLTRTQLPMPKIARASGLTDARQLSTVFRQATGTTPTRFRRDSRGED